MNALTQPAITPTLRTPNLPALIQDRIAARREALTALDSFVRPLLAERLRMPLAFGRPTLDLTVYDDVLRRSNAGGHWTATSRWFSFIGHTVGSYAVTLHFDAGDRPSHFVISGAGEVRTDDASPESLARGLDAAVRAGPLVTWAPNFVPSISL